jgi:hypothetical protein
VSFKIIGRISDVETITSGKGIQEAASITKVVWRTPLEEAERNGNGQAGRWYDVLCGSALVRGARYWCKRTKDQADPGNPMKRSEPQFVVCVKNKGYAASLELRKLYRVVADEAATKLHQIRVIDESGEDYLYPEEYFVPVDLPHSAEKAILRAVGVRS